MVNLTRNKRSIYLCTKKEDSLEFNEPEEIKVNCLPTYSSTDTLALGINATMYQTIKCSPKIARKFSNTDRIYLNKPETFDPSCNDADYYVYGNPIITINEGEVSLRKMNGEGEYE